MFITTKYLKRRDACKEGLEWFKREFPDGGEYKAIINRLCNPDYTGWLLWAFENIGPDPVLHQTRRGTSVTGGWYAGDLTVDGDIALERNLYVFGNLIVDGSITGSGHIAVGGYAYITENVLTGRYLRTHLHNNRQETEVVGNSVLNELETNRCIFRGKVVATSIRANIADFRGSVLANCINGRYITLESEKQSTISRIRGTRLHVNNLVSKNIFVSTLGVRGSLQVKESLICETVTLGSGGRINLEEGCKVFPEGMRKCTAS